MKSFLKRKQAQVIASLGMAIAVWTMIVGLGLNNGIANAAPAATISIVKQTQLIPGGVHGLITGQCTGFPEVSFAATLSVTVTQGKVSSTNNAVNALECGSASVPFTSTFNIGGPFNLGKAKVSATLVSSLTNTTIAKDNAQVTIFP